MKNKKKVWFKKLGYKENPFSIKPAIYSDELAGYNNAIKKLNTGIKKGQVWMIEGAYGIGKTSVLKKVINHFKGHKKLIYYSANRAESGVNFKKLLTGRTFFNRLFGTMPKGITILMDEAQNLIRTDFEKLEEYIEHGYIRSVIFVSDSLKKVKMTEGLKILLDGHIIKLAQLFSENNAVKMVQKRIDGVKFMPAKVIKYVYSKSQKNPRNLLENCEDLTQYVIDELERKAITIEHAKKFFSNKK